MSDRMSNTAQELPRSVCLPGEAFEMVGCPVARDHVRIGNDTVVTRHTAHPRLVIGKWSVLELSVADPRTSARQNGGHIACQRSPAGCVTADVVHYRPYALLCHIDDRMDRDLAEEGRGAIARAEGGPAAPGDPVQSGDYHADKPLCRQEETLQGEE